RRHAGPLPARPDDRFARIQGGANPACPPCSKARCLQSLRLECGRSNRAWTGYRAVLTAAAISGRRHGLALRLERTGTLKANGEPQGPPFVVRWSRVLSAGSG